MYLNHNTIILIKKFIYKFNFVYNCNNIFKILIKKDMYLNYR